MNFSYKFMDRSWSLINIKIVVWKWVVGPNPHLLFAVCIYTVFCVFILWSVYLYCVLRIYTLWTVHLYCVLCIYTVCCGFIYCELCIYTLHSLIRCSIQSMTKGAYRPVKNFHECCSHVSLLIAPRGTNKRVGIACRMGDRNDFRFKWGMMERQIREMRSTYRPLPSVCHVLKRLCLHSWCPITYQETTSQKQ